MSKSVIVFTAIVLIMNFIFTSGFWFWLSDCKDTSRITTPFAYSLSAEKTGLVGITTQSDLDCIDWILNKSDQSMKVMVDSNAVFLMTGHLEKFQATWIVYGKADRLLSLFAIAKFQNGYIFLTDWNTRHERYIEPSDIGLRNAYPVSVKDGTMALVVFDVNTRATSLITCNVKESYRSGNSVVYERQ